MPEDYAHITALSVLVFKPRPPRSGDVPPRALHLQLDASLARADTQARADVDGETQPILRPKVIAPLARLVAIHVVEHVARIGRERRFHFARQLDRRAGMPLRNEPRMHEQIAV